MRAVADAWVLCGRPGSKQGLAGGRGMSFDETVFRVAFRVAFRVNAKSCTTYKNGLSQRFPLFVVQETSTAGHRIETRQAFAFPVTPLRIMLLLAAFKRWQRT